MLVLSLLLLLAGLYNFIFIIIKNKLYKTTLLLMYYIFTLLLLIVRLITFSLIVNTRINSVKNWKICDHLVYAALLSTTPNFLYMYGGMCQLFIIIKILALWNLAYFQMKRSDQSLRATESENY